MKNEKGYTTVELLIAILFVLALVVGGGIVWALIHFISKFW